VLILDIKFSWDKRTVCNNTIISIPLVQQGNLWIVVRKSLKMHSTDPGEDKTDVPAAI
jgi:hypothetical protein